VCSSAALISDQLGQMPPNPTKTSRVRRTPNQTATVTTVEIADVGRSGLHLRNMRDQISMTRRIFSPST